MDIVEQVINVVRSGSKITDVSHVDVTDGELIKYLEVGAAELVASARKDLVIAKQAALIQKLYKRADTDNEDVAAAADELTRSD